MAKERTHTWGGKRAGAGRKATSPFVAHVSRPEFEGRRAPLLVTLRFRSGFPSLRSETFLKIFERAASRARRFGLRITHFNVLPKSIVMMCEFHEREALERSFKSLNTTLAIALKRRYFDKTGEVHSGPVFLGRFKMEILDSGARVKAALRQILTAFSDKARRSTVAIDAFSSFSLFTEWKRLLSASDPPLSTAPPPAHARARAVAVTALPQFWLTRAGWRKA